MAIVYLMSGSQLRRKWRKVTKQPKRKGDKTEKQVWYNPERNLRRRLYQVRKCSVDISFIISKLCWILLKLFSLLKTIFIIYSHKFVFETVNVEGILRKPLRVLLIQVRHLAEQNNWTQNPCGRVKNAEHVFKQFFPQNSV